MNKLQDLIERIVESKVASVLEEGLRRKERRKAKRERERKEGKAEIAKLPKTDARYEDWAESSPEEREGMAVAFGRGANKPKDPPDPGQYTDPIGREEIRKQGRLKFNKFTKPLGDNKAKRKSP